MLRDIRRATFIALALASAAMTRAADADDGMQAERPPGAAAARLPDGNGTADVVVSGERLPPGEIDARVGWLVETYLLDARAALRHDRAQEAAETLARARSALDTLVHGTAGPSRAPSTASGLATDLDRAANALSAGDHARADRALADGGHRLHAALVELDDVLQPQSGKSGY